MRGWWSDIYTKAAFSGGKRPLLILEPVKVFMIERKQGKLSSERGLFWDAMQRIVSQKSRSLGFNLALAAD
jgi:hypothetical protein